MILVTGATGMLGANVARALLDAGRDVRVIARAGSDRRVLEGLPIEVVPGSLDEPSSLLGAARGCDGLIHCAAHVWIGRTGDDAAWRVNVEGTRNVLHAALQAGVSRIVHVSTVDALSLRDDGAPAREEDRTEVPMVGCGYVLSKRAAEAVALERAAAGQAVVVVNPAFLVGPYDPKPSSGRMILAVASGRARFAPSGGNSFVDVGVAARSIVAALERGTPGRRYVLAGENLTYLEAWRRIARVVGAPGPLGVVPRPLVVAAGQAGAVWGRLVGREPEVNPVTAAYGTLPHYFASDRARAELGHGATDFESSVREAWDWLRRRSPPS